MAQRLDVRYVSYYTDGSAARKAAPVQPFVTAKLPRVKKQKRIVVHVDPVATAGILLSAVMLVLLIVGAVQLSSTRENAARMEAYVQTLQQENAELTATYESGYDLEDVRKTALALGFVPKDQVKHVTLQLPKTVEKETPGAWERFCTFLTGLFA